MPDSRLIRRENEFTPQEKRAVEILVGRPLQAGESVSLHVYPARSAANSFDQDRAWRGLLALSDKMAENAKDVPHDELEAAINEACDHVRHNPR
jgi:hypothetical protein